MAKNGHGKDRQRRVRRSTKRRDRAYRPTSAGGAADRLAGARLALMGGEPQRAYALCRERLAVRPDDVDALSLAGVAAFQAGLLDDAVELLSLAVAAAPDHAESSFNFAVLMEGLQRWPEALDAYRKTLERDAEHGSALHGLGNALKALGRLGEARAAYEAALADNPSQPAARVNLGAAVHELGNFEGAAAQCRRALAAAPTLTEARYNLGLAQQETGDLEGAAETYRLILATAPGHAAAAHNRADVLQRLGDLEAAAEAYDRALAIDPHFAKAQVNRADLSLQQGEPEAALAFCDAFLADHPGNTQLLAFKAVTLGDAGRADEAARLVDFERLLKTVSLMPPAGYATLEEFNRALCGHILAHPTLTPSPRSHATRGGRHSGELLSEPKGPFADLETLIRAAADGYRTALGEDRSHPFLAQAPAHLSLSVWSVVLGPGGHQIPHIHPAAWLSGVYYAEVPDRIGAGNGDWAGWLEFGCPPTTSTTAGRRRPEPGCMVLFPSYFYHHTIPFTADERRISIAFDLMPAEVT